MTDEETPRHGDMEDTEAGGQKNYLGELDGFYLIKHLGDGGMGSVYLAESIHNPEMKRAIKILKPDSADCLSELIDRWKVECQVSERLRALKHKHIVQVYDGKAVKAFNERSGEYDSVFYLAMEHVNGETLRKLLQGPSISLEEALKVGVDVASALEAAHDIGIMHRDVKPGNIMVDYRVERAVHAYLLDYGISKLRFESGNITKMHGEAAVGTIGYMPPEELLRLMEGAHTGLLEGELPETTEKGDVFAFGKVLYEMFARIASPESDPTESKSKRLMANVMRALNWSPKKVPVLSAEVNDLIREMTLWKPELRPDMRDVRALLGQELYQKDTCAGTQPIVIGPQEVRLERLIKDLRNEALTEEEFVRSHGKYLLIPTPGYNHARHPNLKVPENFSHSTTYVRVFAPKDKREWVFGRGAETDYKYREPTMSKVHFKISLSPVQLREGEERFTITDLGSSNGTQLQGVALAPMKPEFIISGDEIRAGNAVLTFTRPADLRKNVDTIQFKVKKEDKTPQQKRFKDSQSGA